MVPFFKLVAVVADAVSSLTDRYVVPVLANPLYDLVLLRASVPLNVKLRPLDTTARALNPYARAGSRGSGVAIAAGALDGGSRCPKSIVTVVVEPAGTGTLCQLNTIPG
jgi:hypothetical protein